jgi:hypothetical protein
VLVVVLVIVGWAGAGRAVAASVDEFSDPSPNGPPAASVYNTTPPPTQSCPTFSESQPYCSVEAPNSALPPADTSNPETYLNSAYWPAEKRPDVEMYAIQQYGYDYENCSDPSTWNHYCFLVDAEAVGYPVSQTPQVGDLFLARCESFVYANPAWSSTCPLGNIYYLGYVEQVEPDGTFIVTEGGSSDANDSGLGWYWLSGAMDPNSDFIGFFPAGQSPSLPPVQVEVYDAHGTSGNGAGGAGTVRDSNGQTCKLGPANYDCTFSEPQGVAVTFTATPNAGSTFTGFGFCGTATTCTLTFGRDGGQVGADFELPVTRSSRGGDKTRRAPAARARIFRVLTARGTIRARISGARPRCALALRVGRRWSIPHRARCTTSVVFRRLPAGRYRLTVVSGRTSAHRDIRLRHGAPPARHRRPEGRSAQMVRPR